MNQHSIINYLQQHLWWMLLLFLVILQIPFLQADPDLFLSHSRDAHSDEGLNTVQIRNYVNFGYLNPWECDNLMKNPLFNLILWLPFEIFGTKWIVARLTVLTLVIAAFALMGINKSWRTWLTFIIPVVLFQFHVFQYSHFALAEMLAIGFIILGMYFLVTMFIESDIKKGNSALVLGLICIHFSWFTKIQFLYVEVVALIFIFIYLLKLLMSKKNAKHILQIFITSLLTTGILIGLYYFLWYSPYQEPFNYIMNNQASNRFGFNKYFWQIVAENYNRYFSTQYVKPFWIIFLVTLPLGVWTWIKSQNPRFKAIMLFLSAWIFIELHKITIQHVPSRYLLSGYIACLLWVGTTGYGIYTNVKSSHEKNGKGLFILFMILLIGLWGTHMYSYFTSYQRRTFQIAYINQYIRNYNQHDLVVIGPWAPTISWNSHIKSLPVWKDFLNDKKIKDNFHPDIVVTEPGEADSDGAFCADNFDVVNEADSVKKIWIGKWPVHIYWMKK